MASRIRAIGAYRPRIDLNEMMETADLARYISRGTALNYGEILNVMRESNEAITFFALQGTPIKIEGLGIFRPSMRIDGSVSVSLRMDPSIRRAADMPGAFKGTVINPGNVGLTTMEMVELWNREHPDDPVED